MELCIIPEIGERSKFSNRYRYLVNFNAVADHRQRICAYMLRGKRNYSYFLTAENETKHIAQVQE
jgi:hypothetical protein